MLLWLGGRNGWMPPGFLYLAVCPWREVATGNCLLSAGTEGCGYQLLRAAEAGNTHHAPPCLQCPAASHGHAQSSHLWMPGTHCDQPLAFQTGEDNTEVAGQVLMFSLVLTKPGTCCSVSVAWTNRGPWSFSQTRHRSRTEIFVPHLPQQSCGCWLEWQKNRGLGCLSPKSLKPWLDGWDLEHSQSPQH